MREYVFLLEYDYGVHPVRDVFIDNPDVVATTLDISIAQDTGWRIERVTGPEHALDELESVYFDEHRSGSSSTSSNPACDSTLEYHETLDYQVIEREPTARTVYRHENDMRYCSSLGYLALKSLGDGLVFDATQRGPYYEWRVLVPTERNIDAFGQTLREDLPEGVSLTIRRIGTPERWLETERPRSETELSFEQREAIETARRMGYYNHPREATMADIAAELDLPMTTLRYRLHRAEAWATATALGDGEPDTISSITPKGPDDLPAPTVLVDEEQ
jgi:hypothetical protein